MTVDKVLFLGACEVQQMSFEDSDAGLGETDRN